MRNEETGALLWCRYMGSSSIVNFNWLKILGWFLKIIKFKSINHRKKVVICYLLSSQDFDLYFETLVQSNIPAKPEVLFQITPWWICIRFFMMRWKLWTRINENRNTEKICVVVIHWTTEIRHHRNIMLYCSYFILFLHDYFFIIYVALFLANVTSLTTWNWYTHRLQTVI